MKFVPEHLQKHFEETCKKYSINTPLRKAHFLAQVTHESLDFMYKQENLNYSAKGLSEVWSGLFATKDEKGKPIKGSPNELAKSIAHKPELIANYAYANKGGNGDVKSGDGWRYRGRGAIQRTLKNNYVILTRKTGIDFVSNPDLLLQDNYGMMSAGSYWHDEKNLNVIADLGDTDEVVRAITKIVNGGFNGLDDRIKRFNNIIKDLS